MMNVKRCVYYLCCTVIVGIMALAGLGMVLGLYRDYGITPLIVLAVVAASIAGMIFFHDA